MLRHAKDVRSSQPLFCNQPPRGKESKPERARENLSGSGGQLVRVVGVVRVVTGQGGQDGKSGQGGQVVGVVGIVRVDRVIGVMVMKVVCCAHFLVDLHWFRFLLRKEGRKNGEVEGTLWYPHRPKKAEIKAKYHCRESQMTGVGKSLGPSLV